MANTTSGKLASVLPGFDYGILKPLQADRVRSTANAIRKKLTTSLVGLIDVGQCLLIVKDLLPHGQFGAWLGEEFGWAERTARNLMAVALVFGSKTALIADLDISPTALYLLAAHSTPFEARQEAFDRAKSGEKITPAVVNQIIVLARHMGPRKLQKLPADQFIQRLSKILEHFWERCNPADEPEFAQHLRQFAGLLDSGGSYGKNALPSKSE